MLLTLAALGYVKQHGQPVIDDAITFSLMIDEKPGPPMTRTGGGARSSGPRQGCAPHCAAQEK